MAVDPKRIEGTTLFSDFTADQLDAAASKFEERPMHPGQRLTMQGGGGYFFFVIESGSAEVKRGDDVVAEFGPGDFFGEAAIFETLRRTATVTATSDGMVLAMFGADFAMLTDQIPELRKRIDAAIAERLPHT
jgi:CRP/FNR family cyclic AMP-dependent transcriptional regulator